MTSLNALLIFSLFHIVPLLVFLYYKYNGNIIVQLFNSRTILLLFFYILFISVVYDFLYLFDILLQYKKTIGVQKLYVEM